MYKIFNLTFSQALRQEPKTSEQQVNDSENKQIIIINIGSICECEIIKNV